MLNLAFYKFAFAVAVITALAWIGPAFAQFMPDAPRPASVPNEWLENAAPVVKSGNWQKEMCRYDETRNNCGGVFHQGPEFEIAQFVQATPLSPGQKTARGGDNSLDFSGGKKQNAYAKVVNYPMLMARRHDYGAALHGVNFLLRIWPTSPALYWQRGSIYAHLGLADRAVPDFDAAIYWTAKGEADGHKLSRVPVFAFAQMAGALAKLGRVEEAKKALADAKLLDFGALAGSMNEARSMVIRIADLDLAKAAYGWDGRMKTLVDNSINSRVNGCYAESGGWAKAEKVGYRLSDVARQRMRLLMFCDKFSDALSIATKLLPSYQALLKANPSPSTRVELAQLHIDTARIYLATQQHVPAVEQWVAALELYKTVEPAMITVLIDSYEPFFRQATSGDRKLPTTLDKQARSFLDTGVVGKRTALSRRIEALSQ